MTRDDAIESDREERLTEVLLAYVEAARRVVRPTGGS
jgi:hypothetical protein